MSDGWVSDELRECKTKAVGDYVLLKSRKQAGVRDEGKIISNLYRCRYQVLSLGGNANAKLSFTVKEGDIVFISKDDVFNIDGMLFCKWDAIACVCYEGED